MKKSWKNTLMTFACIGALFTATEASARGHHHHHGSKDLHRAAAIVDIVTNCLSILGGNAPVVVQPAPTVVTPAPAYVAPPSPVYVAPSRPVYVAPSRPVYVGPSRPVYVRPAPSPRRVRVAPPPRAPRHGRSR